MNPTVDTSSSVERVAPEQKLRCRQPTDDPGGGGINVTRAIRKLGGESKAFYPAGGWYGEKLKELLSHEGIDHVPIPIRGATRQDLIILDEGARKQYRFQMPGPKLDDSELDSICKVVGDISPSPRYLVASGSLPPGVPADFYARIGELACKFGARYIVDTSGEALVHAVRGGAYLVKPNLNELRTLAQREIKDESQIEDAVKSIIESGKTEALVISLGAGGAFLATRDMFQHMRAPTVPIQSKVGAGDSMVAGMVFKLAQGESLQNAARYGVAAGAAAVMTPGTQLCRRDDTERLYERMLSGKHI
jgi:6-phosphofructokinase 2